MKKYIIKPVPIIDKTRIGEVKLCLCSNEVEENDKVVIFEMDGISDRIYDIKVGILTKKWEKDEYPTCELNGKSLDLVSEGHTSKVYKIVCDIDSLYNQKWVKANMEFTEDRVKIIGEWNWKRPKDLVIDDEIEIRDRIVPGSTLFGCTGKIKEIKLVEEGCVDGDDEVLIIDIKKMMRIDENDQPVFEPNADLWLKREDIAGKKWIEYRCELKCPTCEKFH